MKTRGILLLGIAVLGIPARAGGDLILTLDSDPVLSISDDTGPFTLSFANFLQGTLSTTQSVAYRVQANNMVAGTVPGAVSAQISQEVNGILLEGDVEGYQNLGGDNFSSLQEAQSGFRTVPATLTAMADKVPGSGSGNFNLDGNLTITWRARLSSDAAGGSRSRFLIVTLREGS